LLLITAFLNALLAYVTGDIKIVLYKRKTGEINPVVPDEIIDSANELRAPFALALIGILIVLLGFFLTYLFSGSWPFLS
jgi:hypothetical protein